jgi:hypothetical protein
MIVVSSAENLLHGLHQGDNSLVTDTVVDKICVFA